MAKAKRVFLGLALLVYLFAEGPPAAGSAAQINRYQSPYLQVSVKDSWKYSPGVAYAGKHDQYLVVWENLPTSGPIEIYGRRVSAAGQLLGDMFIISSGGHNSKQPAVAYDDIHDRYLVVWSYDSAGDNLNNDIYGRYIPWDGPSATLAPFGIDLSVASSTTNPRVAYGISADRFMLVWKVGGSPSRIGGVTVSGSLSGSLLSIDCGDGDCDFPDVTYNLARDEFVAVWSLFNPDSGLDVYAERFNSNGIPQAPGVFTVAASSQNEQHPTVAACDKADQYLFVWQNQVETTTDDDLSARFMTGGGTLSPIIGIEGATFPQGYPRLSCNPFGTEYLLTWHNQFADPYVRGGVWAKVVHTDQTVESPFQVVAPSETKDRLYPAVANGKNSALIAWQHGREGSDYLDIWAQLVRVHAIFVPLVRR